MQVQDRFAAALRRHGLTPYAADSSGDLAFDIAWRWHGLHVGEVKSLNARNEEKQLRLGLGQVLRYRDLLIRGGDWNDVRPWLIVEREPRDRGWHDLCESLVIHLAWPNVFDARISDLLTS